MSTGGIRQALRDTTPYLFFIMIVTTLGPLQFGFHLAELNAPQDVITCKNKRDLIGSFTKLKEKFGATASTSSLTTPSVCIPMNDAEFAVISSIFTLGGLLGALCAGPLSTSRGRLLTMRLTTLFYVIGSILEAAASSISMMAIGRMLSGIGAGASLVVVPLYIAEIAPPNERGLFGVMTQITINAGILITQTMGYLLSKGSQWRIVLVAGAAIALLNFIGLFFVPESPSWTAANKNATEALRSLQRIRGRNMDITEETENWNQLPQDIFAESEGLLNDPQTTRRASSSSKSSSKNSVHAGFFEVIRDSRHRPAIIAVIGAMFAQQFTGINSVMMYSVSLLSDLFPTTSGLLTIFLSASNLVMTIICAPLSDNFGRKRCLLVSICGMGVSSFCLAFAILFGVQILSAIAVLCFVLSFAIGLGPIPFILASEMVSQEAKGATQSWALGSNWIFTFMVAQFFPIINELLNSKLGGSGWVYFLFAGLALVSALFVGWRVPETKGMRDADEVWGRVRRD